MADFYNGKFRIDALNNQYILIKDEFGNQVDEYKYADGKFVKVKVKPFESQILGKIKPRNKKQILLMDLLQSDVPVCCITGPAGSGKSFLATAWSLQEIVKGNYKKLVVIRNNVSVMSVPEIGATPGDEMQKMKVHCAFIGDIVSDYMFDTLLLQRSIEMVYMGTIRSRSFSDSIILVNESQNLNTDLVRTVIGRVGERARIIFDYDLSQIDKKSFEKDNGMIALSDSLAGNPLFGMVELEDIERSAVARLASLIK